MDFKSRFEGRKAFINKAGNIADAENQQIIVLKKPAQSRNSPQTEQNNLQIPPSVSFGARNGPGGQGDQQIAGALNEWRKAENDLTPGFPANEKLSGIKA